MVEDLSLNSYPNHYRGMLVDRVQKACEVEYPMVVGWKELLCETLFEERV